MTYDLRHPMGLCHSVYIYSLLHLECYFLNLKSQSILQFSRSHSPRSVEKGPMRFRFEIENEGRPKCNRLYIWSFICSISNPNRFSCFLGLFCHVPFKRDQCDLRFFIEIGWRSKCNRLYIWGLIFSISNPNRFSCCLGLFCHVPLKRDQCDLRFFIEIEWRSKCNRLYIWSFICSISNPNRFSCCLGLFCHVPLKRDWWSWDLRLRLKDAPYAIGCRCIQGGEDS